MERLRLLLPHRGVEQTAALLRRSPDSVQRKALDLLRVTPRKGAWTDSDDWQLRQAWGAVELSLLAPMLGRPANEVRSRAAELRSRLKSGSWTREEMRLLKKLYGTRADEDLEVSLMRSRSEIAIAAQRMCLAKDKKFQSACNNAAVDKAPSAGKSSKSKPVVRSRMPRWTSAEVEKLRQIYPDHDNLAVARALGRSVTSVANKAFQIGMHKSAALLTSIGRSNIAHRYQSEEEEAAAVAAAPVPASLVPTEITAGASTSRPVEGVSVATPAVVPTVVPTVIVPTVVPTVIVPTVVPTVIVPTVIAPLAPESEPAYSQARPGPQDVGASEAGNSRVAQEGAGEGLIPSGD
ncbi:MAG: hypothetical protein ACI89X_002905 [Planctomycetota bacterium]